MKSQSRVKRAKPKYVGFTKVSYYRKILLVIFSIFTVFAFLSKFTYASSEAIWKQKGIECYANLGCMLTQVEVSEKIPHFRTNRSAKELFEVLQKTNRFQELGLTGKEGEILVKAVYQKMGVNMKESVMALPGENETTERNALSPSYRAGQEFEKLDGVLMRWPFDWESQKDEWTEMIAAMSNAEVTLYIWVNHLSQQYSAIRYLREKGVPTEHIVWVIERTNSVWMRDYGPQFIYDNQSDGWGVVDFHYYDSRPEDDDTPVFISRICKVPRVNRQTSQVVYTEGGNLNHDGLGCVVYSQRTYSRNSGTDEATVDQRIMSAFQAHLNIVPEDPSLDSTGHVDMFMKIVGEDTVLVAEYDPDQIDYQVLEDCADLFESTTNGAGEPWHIVRIHQPDVYYIFFVLPVVRTYTNSLIVNNVVLLPTYNIPQDQDAITLYERVFPGKTIYPINAEVIIESGGAWHCVAMEYPSPYNPD